MRLALALERLLDSIEDCIRPQRLLGRRTSERKRGRDPALRGANGPGRIAQSGFAPRGTAHGLLSPGCSKESGCGKDRSSKPTRVNSCPGEKGGMNLSAVSAGPIAANSDPQGSKTGWALLLIEKRKCRRGNGLLARPAKV